MSWTHLSEATPKARKEYLCNLCERTIPIGEVHVKRTGINEGGLYTSRMHAVCEGKTHGWDEDQWEYHDPHEFRTLELGLEK